MVRRPRKSRRSALRRRRRQSRRRPAPRRRFRPPGHRRQSRQARPQPRWPAFRQARSRYLHGQWGAAAGPAFRPAPRSARSLSPS
ncbi:hypothetical protein CX676_10915 [Paracoccus zhejiangensis]|uniref:Uncharacterized protein n=1 Tax=Paracoccus zhejiangensis TaxID=1077935 RepID=A0A2H5EZA6_9RHOB|nr:hypothetical protein CX676_10915 [Paracoccus zhejiangensis]